MIIITAKKDGFRRCGIAHSKNKVEYPDDAFSPKDLETLEEEPMLVVNKVPGKATAEKAEEAAAKAADKEKATGK
jgi:hypothetical protein